MQVYAGGLCSSVHLHTWSTLRHTWGGVGWGCSRPVHSAKCGASPVFSLNRNIQAGAILASPTIIFHWSCFPSKNACFFRASVSDIIFQNAQNPCSLQDFHAFHKLFVVLIDLPQRLPQAPWTKMVVFLTFERIINQYVLCGGLRHERFTSTTKNKKL